jgi:hypothetical protein
MKMNSRTLLFSLTAAIGVYFSSSCILFAEGTVVVEESITPHIISTTHPDKTRWYNSRNIAFSWNVPTAITAVRTLYDTREDSVPSKVYAPPINEKSITLSEDGVMYMHVQFKTTEGWGPSAHYRFQIDTQEPTVPQVTFPDGAMTTSPVPAVLIEAEDTTSGLEYLTIGIDGTEPTRYLLDSSHVYRLPKQVPGKHTAFITVYDKAGNKRTTSVEYTILAIAAPKITDYTKNVQSGSPLIVSGTTYPETLVEVVLIDRKGSLITESVTSDDAGNFRLVWSGNLRAGLYEMHARAIDTKGATSEFSDEKVFIVEHAAIVRLGTVITSWLSLALLLIVGVVCVLATLWYSFMQFDRWRRRVHRVMKEAENTLKTNVQALRRDLEEFHRLLVKTQKKRALTKEETTILKKFEKRIEIAEKEIEQKLEQIG